ncbi:hypothetical protein L3V32_25835 [Vibrio sp. J2-4]|nr:hypothetical protein [Vibrio sp. J2-4]MCF7480084.1 hypothetical protein [Vibrio sp. J2-4]
MVCGGIGIASLTP